MSGTTWHVDAEVLSGYAAGRVTAAVAASTEAHLTSCAECRSLLAPAVPAGRLEGIWNEVDDRVERLSLPWFERMLVRCGVGEDTARLLAATPSLSVPWLGSVAAAAVLAAAAVVAIALVATRDGGDREYRKKEQGAPGDYRPRFGGVGRGAGAPPS